MILQYIPFLYYRISREIHLSTQYEQKNSFILTRYNLSFGNAERLYIHKKKFEKSNGFILRFYPFEVYEIISYGYKIFTDTDLNIFAYKVCSAILQYM